MCGIAGFVDSGRGYSVEHWAHTVAAMAAPLRHRGPDDAGAWTDPSAGVALAHRRLSILDVTPTGHQPMTSGSGRFVVTYNGEIYNHAELRAELVARGHTFRGRSDTEVLVEACAAWGVEATLRKLVGMFAFAVWDRATRTLTLARDRIGIKPLFWGRFGELLLFASELKGLRAHRGWTAEIDHGSLNAFMRWGHVPAPYSIYRGLRKLLPGEFLTVSQGASRSSRAIGTLPRSLRTRKRTHRAQTRRKRSTGSRNYSATRSRGTWNRTCRSARSCRAASIRR